VGVDGPVEAESIEEGSNSCVVCDIGFTFSLRSRDVEDNASVV
jgi:hypothetical protein